MTLMEWRGQKANWKDQGKNQHEWCQGSRTDNTFFSLKGAELGERQENVKEDW